jgi:hypothetical protein
MMRLRLFTVHTMAPLTERQQKAQALMHEIHRLGGYVICPMPLGLGERLRFQVLVGPECDAVLEKLRETRFRCNTSQCGLALLHQRCG